MEDEGTGMEYQIYRIEKEKRSKELRAVEWWSGRTMKVLPSSISPGLLEPAPSSRASSICVWYC